MIATVLERIGVLNREEFLMGVPESAPLFASLSVMEYKPVWSRDAMDDIASLNQL